MKLNEKLNVIVFWIVAGIALLFAGNVVYVIGSLLGIFPNGELYHRSATDYARSSIRTSTILLESGFERKKRYPPGKPYWGPFTSQIIKDLDGDPNKLIDPYNREGDPALWRTGPRVSTDRGAPIRVKGLDYWYYSDGKDKWAIVSRGPDRDLDATTQALAQAQGKNPWNTPGLALTLQMYDITNGTVSNGDIIKLKD